MNAFRAYLRDASIFFQFFALLGLMLLGAGLMGAMGLYASETFYGIGLEQLQDYINNPIAPGATPVLKLMQFFTSFGMFLIPAMLFSQLYSPRPVVFLQLNTRSSLLTYLAIVLLILAATPLTDALTWLNDQLHLPSFLADYETTVRAESEKLQSLIGTFMVMNSFGDFLINLLLLAALPALAEEFFFRGIMQELIIRHTNRQHLSVWITALAFGLMHNQLFAMIPLILLGALLGYLKEFTGNLWASILAHFVNNGTIVVVMYFFQYDLSDLDGLTSPNMVYLMPALLICGGLIFWLWKNKTERPDKNADLEGLSLEEPDDHSGM